TTSTRALFAIVTLQRQREHQPRAGIAIGHPEPTAVRFYQATGDSQAEARTVAARGPPLERMEDPLPVADGDARSLVAHLGLHQAPNLRRPNRDGGARWRVEGGILDQVGHHLIDLRIVTGDPGQVV